MSELKVMPPDAAAVLKAHSVNWCAEHYGVCRTVIIRWREEVGLPKWKRTAPLGDIRRQLRLGVIRRLLQEGLSMRKIGKSFGVSGQAIHQLLKSGNR